MVTFYRRLPKFDYLAPKMVEEALSLLSRYKGEARLVAGGTDIVPKLKRRESKRKKKHPLVGLRLPGQILTHTRNGARRPYLS